MFQLGCWSYGNMHRVKIERKKAERHNPGITRGKEKSSFILPGQMVVGRTDVSLQGSLLDDSWHRRRGRYLASEETRPVSSKEVVWSPESRLVTEPRLLVIHTFTDFNVSDKLPTVHNHFETLLYQRKQISPYSLYTRDWLIYNCKITG